MTWFADNSTVIQTLTAIATALIWAVYLQMLLSGVLRQRRPTLSINRGAGEGLQAQIILSNLGYEPIYVQDVLVALDVDGDGTRTSYVTDRRELSDDQTGPGLSGTTQGPMKMGDYISLGTVQGILTRAAPNFDTTRLPGLNEITFIVLGTGQKPGGARKSYRVVRDRGEVRHLQPTRLDTERLSARQCRRIHEDQGSDV
ncbi:hypothetical protein OCH239_12540 [Roseivivax halodurans JCM 10272]|uniref:Uncharacterized protein n=1 Tax=Roseivivax halodurans JCM 10272 TaxID=1449350 RepID=X7EBC6_9RHOB|nr:hypothetical protein [Roseivivax halodurans]ETX13267.1 hypothetical protein OCH239_12540 [Roseivivax halodurans JCM 10272]